MTTPNAPVIDGGTTQLIGQIAREIGVEQSRIGIRNTDWGQFLKQGVIVDMHVGRWRATAKTTLEDLGIIPASNEARAAYERVFSLGARNLLPKAIMDRAQKIDDRGRNWLKANAFRTFWGYFLHTSRYPTWAKKNQEIREEYLKIGEEIGERYDELVRAMRYDLEIVAPEIVERLIRASRAAGQEIPSNMAQAAIERFVERSLAAIPEARTIVNSFSYTWDVDVLPLQSQIAVDRAEAQKIQLEAFAKAQAAAADAMEADLRRSQAERAVEGIDRFVADVVGQITEAAYTVALDALEDLKEGERLPKGTVRQLRNLIETVSTMAFWDTPDLDARMSELGILLDQDVKQRSKSDLTRVLQQVGTIARSSLLEVRRPPQRSGRELGVPMVPTEIMDRTPIQRATGRRDLLTIMPMSRPEPTERAVTRRALPF